MGLLVCLVIHKGQQIFLGKEELGRALLKPDALDLLISAEPLVQLGARPDILQFDLIEGTTLAGLNRLSPHRDPQPVLVFDDISNADCVTVDFHFSVHQAVVAFGSPEIA